MSKANFEKRLGPYRESDVQSDTKVAGDTYEAKPMGHGADTDLLWQQYCEERDFRKERKRQEEKDLYEEMRREISKLFSGMTVTGITVRYFVRGRFSKTLLRYLDIVSRRQKAERIRKRYARQKELRKRYAMKPWRGWVEEQAKQENTDAVELVKAKQWSAVHEESVDVVKSMKIQQSVSRSSSNPMDLGENKGKTSSISTYRGR